MGLGAVFLVFLAFCPSILGQESEDVKLVINTGSTIATTDANYVCATIDWWPKDKCNYNSCPWGSSSALNLNLSHPFLVNAIQAFKSLRIRVGGSLQDQVLYHVGNSTSSCQPFKKEKGGLFGFSKGCLPMKRWDELNTFFRKTGSMINSTLYRKRPECHEKDPRPESLEQGVFDIWQCFFHHSRNGPWASAWVGESGGAYNSGARGISNAFVNTFWYLDQLGMAAVHNTRVYCRQTLIGGFYGLLNKTSFVPTPDYYSALLWHRLMGDGVLSVDSNASPFLRVYAHCAKDRPGVVILLINLSNQTTFNVELESSSNTQARVIKMTPFIDRIKKSVSWIGNRASDEELSREEYELTPENGDLTSTTAVLNGEPLQVNETRDMPNLFPAHVETDAPLSIAPFSIKFVAYPNFNAPGCKKQVSSSRKDV